MEKLIKLYESVFARTPEKCVPLVGSASNRKYYRLSCGETSHIGVVGVDVLENKAFVTIDRQLASKGVNVPSVLAVSDDDMAYIQDDLGDDVLFDLYSKARRRGEGMSEVEDLLCRTVALLPKIQFEGAEGFDFSHCCHQPCYDRQMIMFDLNYFKYCFLKPLGVEFNEVQLQKDFEALADDLLEEDTPTFLYRDFNARNVMVRDGHPYFIDFQGGKRGPIYYDVVSFIHHPRANYPAALKERMLKCYLSELKKYADIAEEDFRERLEKFRLLRLMQVLGAYGFRGMVEQKADFVAAIPHTIENLRGMIAVAGSRYPYLAEMFSRLVSLPRFKDRPSDSRQLVVTVTSFSFKKGMPFDPSGNGGGYVFDCRAINNPGRHIQYKTMTGRDEPVIRFLEEDGGVFAYLDNVYAMVDPHVEAFVAREFTSLMVSFGCTGGQHRSVYCAESFARHIASKYPHVRVRLIHREHPSSHSDHPSSHSDRPSCHFERPEGVEKSVK